MRLKKQGVDRARLAVGVLEDVLFLLLAALWRPITLKKQSIRSSDARIGTDPTLYIRLCAAG